MRAAATAMSISFSVASCTAQIGFSAWCCQYVYQGSFDSVNAGHTCRRVDGLESFPVDSFGEFVVDEEAGGLAILARGGRLKLNCGHDELIGYL